MRELVALEGPPGPGWIEELSRCWDAGDAVLPVDHRLPSAAVSVLYDTMRPSIVAEVGGARRANPDGRAAEPGDALVVATSGTTGTPRGVILTHDAVKAAARATSNAIGVDPASDTWLCCLPLGHAGGLGVLTRAVITGTPVLVHPGFDATAVTAAARALAEDGRDVLVSLVATTLRRVDPGLFRVVLLGGDAPPRWEDGQPTQIIVTYGMTETGGGCVYDGRPLDGMQVRLDDDGQIWLRGPMLGDGWFATGDSGRRVADAHAPVDAGTRVDVGTGVDAGAHLVAGTRLAVDGRLAEVIVTGGEKVWPAPTEAVLAAVPGVAEVAVVGRPDPVWGARVVAVVVPTHPDRPPNLNALRAAVADRLGPWAAPKQLELVTSLPRTALGKVRRSELRPPAAPH